MITILCNVSVCCLVRNFNCSGSFRWYKDTMMTDLMKDRPYASYFAKTPLADVIAIIPTVVSYGRTFTIHQLPVVSHLPYRNSRCRCCSFYAIEHPPRGPGCIIYHRLCFFITSDAKSIPKFIKVLNQALSLECGSVTCMYQLLI